MIEHLLMVTGSYPSDLDPESGAFVRTFAHAVSRQNVKTTVVHAVSVHSRGQTRLPRQEVERIGRSSVTVLRPRYVSVGVRPLLGMNRWWITQRGFENALWRAVRHLDCPPSHVYGHFLYPSGRAAVRLGRALSIDSMAGVGEGAFWTVSPVGFGRAKSDFQDCSRFLAVSTPIREALERDLGVPRERIRVLPNGVDLSVFRPFAKTQARNTLKIDQTLFVVGFVGTFNYLKGGRELIAAVEDIPGIGLFLLGQGELALESKHTVYKGRVPHRDVPTWLNAADVFVLPTQEEGSCNAVLEAMACGVPIVTSNGRYMDDIVDDTVAIRVEPTNIESIRKGVLTLMHNPGLRDAMSRACLQKAQSFNINDRARQFVEWLGEARTKQRPQPRVGPTTLAGTP